MAYNTFDYYKFIGMAKELAIGSDRGRYQEEAQIMDSDYYTGVKDTVNFLLYELGDGRHFRRVTPEILAVLMLAQSNKETMDEVMDNGYEVEVADRYLEAVIEPYAMEHDYKWVLDMFKAGGDYGGRYLSYDNEVDMFFTYYLP